MKFAVIGNPIEHSLSPVLHNWVFRHLKMDFIYEAIRVSSDNVESILKSLKTGKIGGINVTIPYKEIILDFLDSLENHAQHINAVNCVKRMGDKLIGYNTDWTGFSKSLDINNIDVKGKSCILLGAGGAAKGVLYSLIRKDAGSITIINRHRNRAVDLVKQMSPHSGKSKLILSEYDNLKNIVGNSSIIINSTPLGMDMYGNSSPLDKQLFNPDTTYIDVIYTPIVTQFLQFAQAANGKRVSGLDMFIHQALASLEIWFGKSMTKNVDIPILREYLTEHLTKGSSQ